MKNSSTTNNDNFYSLNKYSKSGNFLMKLPYAESSQKDIDDVNSFLLKGYKEFKIKPLTDEELMDNWRLVLPNRLLIKNENSDGKINIKKTNMFHIFHVNMSQLPYHLMKKIKPVYQNKILSHYKVTDKIYKYRVIPSDIDNEILYLAKMMNGYKYDLDKMLEYVLAMEELNLNGWVLKKAKKILKKYGN